MAHVTDYDVWHVSAEPVSVEMVIRVLNENVRHAQQAIRYLAGHLTSLRDCECESALSSALITNPNYIPPDTRAKLSILVDKYLG
jgi:5'-methylthioadenosine phosphorylase